MSHYSINIFQHGVLTIAHIEQRHVVFLPLDEGKQKSITREKSMIEQYREGSFMKIGGTRYHNVTLY